MQFKVAFALSLFAAAQVALAQPPACLLAALNNQQNPADYKTICSKEASTVQKDIQSACSGSDKSTALSAFADTCKQSAGVTVSSVAAASSTAAASASASASASGTASATSVKSTATGFAEGGSGSSSGSGSNSASGSAAKPSATGAGFKSSADRASVGSFAGIVIAAAGVVYIL